MDADIVVKMVFGIIGGLGIFLLGMKNMSEGMQAVAGSRLRKLINAVTNNRILACGVGTLVTTLIQSSSITTVMVVGMVNAGIMNLVQAIGVILGANIGTTITGWILVLKVGKYGLPLLGISAFIFLFSKRDRIRYTASVFLGLGMIFYGLKLMKDGFGPLQGIPAFEAWFHHFSPVDAFGAIHYFDVIKCCLVGAVLTAVVQSSSATLGITIGLASSGIIDYPTAAALVLGENIGTTITAILASIGASINAKRASYAHLFVNIFGVIWITSIFSFYIGLVTWFVGTDPETGEIRNVTEAIAVTHTGFNVINVMVLLPFIGLLSKLLYKIVPDKAIEEVPHLTFLDVRMLDTPSIGIQQSQKEILRMGKRVKEMLDLLGSVIANQRPDEKKESAIFKSENDLDIMQKEIVEFIGNIMTGNIAHDVIDNGRSQLRMADEYESVSDYIVSVLKLNLKMRDTGQEMSQEGLAEILDLHNHVSDYISMINQGVEGENKDVLPEAQTQGRRITALMKKYRSLHLDRVESGVSAPLKSLIYIDMLSAYRRIKDHALNIAEVLTGEK